MIKTVIRQRLNAILNESQIQHSVVVQNLDIKDTHVYCKANRITGQNFGHIIECRVINLLRATKLNSSLECGDFSLNAQNYELKTSLGGKSNSKFNYVQIRPHHNIDFYMLTAYYLNNENVGNNGTLYTFKIPHRDMIQILLKHGTYAHGCKRTHGEITLSKINNSTLEYALRPKFNNVCWKTMMQFCTTQI